MGSDEPGRASFVEAPSFVDEVWFFRRPEYDSLFFGQRRDGFEVFRNLGVPPDDVDTFVVGSTVTPPVLPQRRSA